MKEHVHTYKNAKTIETLDDKGNVLNYRQYNDGIIIIDRKWEYDHKGRKTVFIDGPYTRRTSYHKLGFISITNQWDSEGRHSKFYFEGLEENLKDGFLKFRVSIDGRNWEYKTDNINTLLTFL